MTGRFDNNVQVVSLSKSYTCLKRHDRMQLSLYIGLMNLNMCDSCGINRIKRDISLRTGSPIA